MRTRVFITSKKSCKSRIFSTEGGQLVGENSILEARAWMEKVNFLRKIICSQKTEESYSCFRKADVARWKRKLQQLLKFDEAIQNSHIKNLDYIRSDRIEFCTNGSLDLLSADYF